MVRCIKVNVYDRLKEGIAAEIRCRNNFVTFHGKTMATDYYKDLLIFRYCQNKYMLQPIKRKQFVK